MELVDDFNMTLLDLVNNIADICPESLIGNNIKSIRETFNKVENKESFIGVFITKILKYKDRIDKGDEDFFLNITFDDVSNGNNRDTLIEIFKFKNIWKKLTRNNKDIIIEYLKILCALAEQYFLYIDSKQRS